MAPHTNSSVASVLQVRSLFEDEERSLMEEVEELMALLEDEDADRTRQVAGMNL